MPARQIFFIECLQDSFFTKNLGGPSCPKLFLSLIIALLAIFFIWPRGVLAQVVINEFSSGTTSDWVEIFNNGESKEISSLKLVDNAGNEISFPNCVLNTSGTYALNWSNRLDNAGDKITLVEGSTIRDCVSYGGGPACEGREIDLPVMASSEFGAREPDGTGSWVKKTSSTKSDNSYCVLETPTSTPTPTLTLSPATGTYKINEVKDGDGNTLSSVYVYVDGEYTHHYAPEDLTFGDGKYCDDDKEVECGFGQHTIKLEKSGYENWEKTITVESGFYDEDNPVMEKSSSDSSSTATPTSSVIASPTPAKKTTPTKSPSPSPTPEGEILGEEATPEAEITSSETPAATPSSFNFQNFLPHFFIGVGGLFLLVSGGSVLLPKLKKKYNMRKHGKNEEVI